MDDPLRVHSPREFEFFLEVTPCARCGHGPLAAAATRAKQADPSDQPPARIRTRCKTCKAQRTFRVEWVEAADDQSSEIVDLAQWMGLYFLYADRMEKAASPADSREAAALAAHCLAEALKFYGLDEMPPESAFRNGQSSAAFQNNPAMFARTHLRELEALLPVQHTIGRDANRADAPAAPAGDARHEGRKPWWKVWKKEKQS